MLIKYNMAIEVEEQHFLQRPKAVVAITFGLSGLMALLIGSALVLIREVLTYSSRPLTTITQTEITANVTEYRTAWGGHIYSLTLEPSTRCDVAKAKDICKEREGQLVSIESRKEQEFLLNFIYDAATAKGIAIPGQDRDYLSFWTSGEVVEFDKKSRFAWPLRQLMWTATNKNMEYFHLCSISALSVYYDKQDLTNFMLMFDMYDDPHHLLGCWKLAHRSNETFFICKMPMEI